MIKTLGRLFLGSTFIYGGLKSFLQPDYIAGVVEAKGLPAPRQLAILNAAVMTIGGSTLAAGVLPKLSAAALAGSMSITTIMGHAFWEEKDAATCSNIIMEFCKNLSIIGGLLYILVDKRDSRQNRRAF